MREIVFRFIINFVVVYEMEELFGNNRNDPEVRRMIECLKEILS